MAKTERRRKSAGFRSDRPRFARPKTRRPKTSPVLDPGASDSPITVICSAPTRGRCARSRTRSSRLWRIMESRPTSKARIAPTDPVDPHRLLRLHRARLRARDAPLLRSRAALGQRRARGHPARDLTGAPGRSPPATASSPSSSRRPARRAEKHSITPRAVRSATPAGSRSRRSPGSARNAAAIRWRRGASPRRWRGAPAAAAAGRSCVRAGRRGLRRRFARSHALKYEGRRCSRGRWLR